MYIRSTGQEIGTQPPGGAIHGLSKSHPRLPLRKASLSHHSTVMGHLLGNVEILNQSPAEQDRQLSEVGRQPVGWQVGR